MINIQAAFVLVGSFFLMIGCSRSTDDRPSGVIDRSGVWWNEYLPEGATMEGVYKLNPREEMLLDFSDSKLELLLLGLSVRESVALTDVIADDDYKTGVGLFQLETGYGVLTTSGASRSFNMIEGKEFRLINNSDMMLTVLVHQRTEGF